MRVSAGYIAPALVRKRLGITQVTAFAEPAIWGTPNRQA